MKEIVDLLGATASSKVDRAAARAAFLRRTPSAGSQRGSTRLTCKRLRRYCMSCLRAGGGGSAGGSGGPHISCKGLNLTLPVWS
jgi:hypothetical protein